MRWDRTPIVRTAAISIALLALAFSPLGQNLVNDGKARNPMEPGMHAAMAAEWLAALPAGPQECTDGFAGPFPCENVDLASVVTIPELGAGTGSDVWGWYDHETEREIAIPTTTLGAAFVDVTDPTAPIVLGRMLIGQDDRGVLWRDVKVYRDHAYVVSEHSGTHLYVFDLTRLRELDSDQGMLEPDLIYDEFGSAHNIAINTETGFAYVVGSDTCDGGLHIVDIREPKEPTFVGCFDEDGYTHDVQCVIYRGPDTRYQGQEICFASNENTLTIVDVTDKSNPVMLSRSEYDTFSYTHQGWLTDDHRFHLFGDELDELDMNVPNTATYIIEVADLEKPGEVQTFLHDTRAIDHNLYIHNDLVWQANYTSGLQVLSFTEDGLRNGELTREGFFDVFPEGDAPIFAGAWTSYPYFPSGTIVVNSFDTGMFVLTSDLNPATEPVQDGAAEPAPDPDPEPEPQPDDDAASIQLPATGGGMALLALALLGGGIALVRLRRAS
jgi:choice-of-anchor B domain-containing protein